MGLPTELNPLMITYPGYIVGRSLRFRASASAYLNRTPASTSSRTTFTLSTWVKVGIFNATSPFLLGLAGTTNGSQRSSIRLESDNLVFGDESMQVSSNVKLQSNAVFRDPSAWYHVVVAVDTTQATSTNRIKMYVNGVQITSFSTANYPSLNYSMAINLNNTHYISRWYDSSAGSAYADWYLAEYNFIDGQQLTPSSFGFFDGNGIWQPTRYTGTYGTNGFYLPFSNTTSTTTLVQDSSGNGNNWTPNNISLTAGATYDSMIDSPTVSVSSSNYAVLNPLNKGTNQTIANGNLTNTSSGHGTVLASIGIATGKLYGEATLSVSGPGGIGFTSNQAAESSYTNVAGKWWCYDNTTNFIIANQTSTTAYATRFSASQVWQWAIDVTNGKAWIGVNNAWLNSTNGTTGDPATGANPTFTFTAGTLIWPFLENAGGPTWNANFGQRPFSYTPPTGFVALNAYNLPTPTINNGAQYIAATTYTGTGSTLTVTNGGNNTSGTTFSPDFVWVKGRSGATSHNLSDVLRGTASTLFTNTTAAENANTQRINAFNSNGFSVGTDTDVNTSSATYVGWQWKAGGTGVTNTSGTITSTVSANPTAGFSVVTYTGTGTAPQSIGHGLGVSPSMIILKRRDSTSDWYTNHVSIGTNDLRLNTTDASAANGIFSAKSSTTFTINSTIVQSGTWVAYCFAAVSGYSAMGSYTGNGSADGPFVFTNFRPRWLMWKRTDVAGDGWWITDSTRNTYNVANLLLYAQSSTSETTSPNTPVDYLSNGFKIRNGTDGSINGAGGTYIYAAFAENPFKFSRAR